MMPNNGEGEERKAREIRTVARLSSGLRVTNDSVEKAVLTERQAHVPGLEAHPAIELERRGTLSLLPGSRVTCRNGRTMSSPVCNHTRSVVSKCLRLDSTWGAYEVQESGTPLVVGDSENICAERQTCVTVNSYRWEGRM